MPITRFKLCHQWGDDSRPKAQHNNSWDKCDKTMKLSTQDLQICTFKMKITKFFEAGPNVSTWKLTEYMSEHASKSCRNFTEAV